jgi:phosphate:Na+ symporter
LDFVYAMLVLGGAVALLLWGAHMVQTGVQRAFGPRLQAFLKRTLRRRLVAFFAGIGITLLLQSSTATGLMATGFAAGALVDLVPALAVMAGANVGTALIVQVLSFDIAAVAPIFVLAGVLLFRRGPNAVLHDLVRVLIGLGLMLIALHEMLAVIAPYAQSSDLRLMLRVLTDIPVLALLLAAIAAWLVHSSVAIVLLIITLAAHGVVPLEAAIVLVLGANLGTALNPLFEGASATDPVARRVPVGNLLNRIVGVLLAITLAGPIAGWLTQIGLTAGPATAAFHVAFNIVMALVMLPLLDPLASLLRRMLPEPPQATDPKVPLYLDPAAREVPEVGLGGAAREVLRLADTLEKMLVGARDALSSNDRKLADAVGEALLDAGLLAEKSSVGQRHVFLNPRRAGDIRRLIDTGELPSALHLPHKW